MMIPTLNWGFVFDLLWMNQLLLTCITGVNAVCTHLGCVVPWNKAANKFMCPCHGSQYDKNGKVRFIGFP